LGGENSGKQKELKVRDLWQFLHCRHLWPWWQGRYYPQSSNSATPVDASPEAHCAHCRRTNAAPYVCLPATEKFHYW